MSPVPGKSPARATTATGSVLPIAEDEIGAATVVAAEALQYMQRRTGGGYIEVEHHRSAPEGVTRIALGPGGIAAAGRIIPAEKIFEGEREVFIELDGERYRLPITRRGKLILQK